MIASTLVQRAVEAAHHIEGANRVLGFQEFGSDPAAVREYGDHFHAEDIFLEPQGTATPGEWLDSETLLSKTRRRRNAYYADFVCKHRMRQILCFVLDSPRTQAPISPRVNIRTRVARACCGE